MAVIWGLDMKEMQWGKFKSGYMWNNTYHNRRTKFIIYQLAMILCVVSESLGTAALSDYVDQQKFVSKLDRNVMIHNNNFVGIASYNIFVGIFVATIFGAAFFFDLFWPERQESRGVINAWKACSVFACMLTLSDALAYTYITASKSAHLTGTDFERGQGLLSQFKKAGETPLAYNKNGRAIASVVFLWPGMIFTFVSSHAGPSSRGGPSSRPGPWTPRRDSELNKLKKKHKTDISVVRDGPADPPALGRWGRHDAAHGPVEETLVEETPIETLIERNRAAVQRMLQEGDPDRDEMIRQRSEELLNKNKDFISERPLSPQESR
ncbi:uncharacterized protein J4E87_010460 [Alternaria ethzedia]|uniref:uncharacterized protein n=1 Tax=Alternaria ethzedia TaxID=181014 RepID=UPI0020C3825E|nr:uncharacterized protein J4E87_010460 [Alternaria ethzedia]KAI4611610.1 hypothetical protein J4E87_010460 [Alternaria ethzedia]